MTSCFWLKSVLKIFFSSKLSWDLIVGEISYLRGFGLTSGLGLNNKDESKNCLFFFPITGRFEAVKAQS